MSMELSTAEVARILGTPEKRVREWVRSGLCHPERRGNRYQYSFQNLVILRTAKGLLEAGVPPARVKRALAALAAELDDERPLSGLRVWADGRDVAVRDDAASWQPETGQTLLDFDVAELAEHAASLSPASREPTTAVPVADLEEAERAERARDEFNQALDLEETDPSAACDAYGRALELDPDLIDAYVNLGRMAHSAGDARRACQLYHMALERSPLDPLIHYNLALALEDTAGPTPAAAHYEKAISLDPTFADAHYNLAGLCERLGRRMDALRHYREYKRLTER